MQALRLRQLLPGEGRTRIAEEWARSVHEGPEGGPAVRPVRLEGAHRQARSPTPPPGHILGYRIEANTPGYTRFSVGWRIGLHRDLVMSMQGGFAVLTSLMQNRTRPSKILWAIAVRVHEIIVPRWLSRAAAAGAPDLSAPQSSIQP